MEITTENLNDLHLKVNININPKDYLPKVEESIKTMGKKMNIPGFRPGHVPPGMVKKIYGNEALADELNKLIADTLDNYIKEKNLKILGQPMPVADEKKQVVDIQSPSEYDFKFELGIHSDFQLPDLNAHEFSNYNVSIEEKTVEDEIEKLRVRYGNAIETEAIKNDSVLSIIFKEMNDDGNEKDGGIETTRRISIESFKNEEIKNQISSLKKGENIVIDIFKAYNNDAELITHNILDISHSQADSMNHTFKISIDGIFEIQKAELNQDLYDKLFGEGKVKSEKELKEKIREELGRSYKDIAHSRLLADLTDYLIDNTTISFPDEFLKKWILSNNAKPVTPEQVENEFGQFSRQLKWDLIFDRIIKDNDLKVNADELKAAAKNRMKQQYFGGQIDEAMEQYLEQFAIKMLEDEKQRRNYFNMAMEEKIFEVIKKKANIQPREISYHDFTHTGNHGHHHHHH